MFAWHQARDERFKPQCHTGKLSRFEGAFRFLNIFASPHQMQWAYITLEQKHLKVKKKKMYISYYSYMHSFIHLFIIQNFLNPDWTMKWTELVFSEDQLTFSEACPLNLVLFCGVSHVVLLFCPKILPWSPLRWLRYIKFKPSGVNFTPFLSTCSYCSQGRIDRLPKFIELCVANGGNMEFREKANKQTNK